MDALALGCVTDRDFARDYCRGGNAVPEHASSIGLAFWRWRHGDQFAEKTVISAFSTVLFQALVTIVILAVAVAAPKCTADLDPSDTSAIARRYRKSTDLMVRTMLLLAAAVNVCMLLAALQIWGGAQNMPGWLVFLPFLLGAAAITGVSLYKGRDERRARAERIESGERGAHRDDDGNWLWLGLHQPRRPGHPRAKTLRYWMDVQLRQSSSEAGAGGSRCGRRRCGRGGSHAMTSTSPPRVITSVCAATIVTEFASLARTSLV